MDNLIEKAVDIWCKAIHNPIHDNGDDSEQGFMGSLLISMNTQSSKEGMSNIVKQVEIFRDELTSRLKGQNENDRLNRWLDVDYHPCSLLMECAEKADIPANMFSIKSCVAIYDDHIDVRFGYSAKSVKYYPLPDGRWLLTSLSGDDISKIIKHVMDSNSIGFEVEA